jgi:transcription initiation factor TFIIH subunit 2
MLEYAREFVTEWFDQNPLGQIGIVGMRGGIGERIGEMSGAFVLPARGLVVGRVLC